MELYQLIATINNTSTSFTFDFLPENFEGIKISQKFSFQNPIGYTPKFSVDTMRIIKGDKAAIDAVFDAYGLESDVTIEIRKLKAVGFGYDSLSNFAIDFESYEKFDDYSEFALKSISTIDYYNQIKSRDIQFTIDGTYATVLPNTQKLINYVSLKSSGFRQVTPQFGFFQFVENNTSKIFNKDTSLSDANKESIYKMGNALSGSIRTSMRGSIKLDCSTAGAVRLRIQINNGLSTNYFNGGDYNLVLGYNELVLPVTFYEYIATFTVGAEMFVILEADAGAAFDLSPYTQLLFVDLKRKTDVKLVGADNIYLKFYPVSSVLQSIFNNNANIEMLFDYAAITSAMSVMSKSDSVNFKPSDFLKDLSIALGAVVNFKNDGSVDISLMDTYFDALLDVDNAIEITDFKDVSVKYNQDLSYSGVNVGLNKNDYDVYSYFENWNKVLSFAQSRNSDKTLELIPSKIRFDFSGLLDYFYKGSNQTDSNSSDIFIFYSDLSLRFSNSDFYLYDYFTPRDIATYWKKFLSFAFQNFGKDTLILSANGGTSDNLVIDGVAQFDDIELNEAPRLLPIEYNFTCLLDSVDFSEKILKVTHEGETVYLFVFEAETTDKLSEQKIKALKIQF